MTLIYKRVTSATTAFMRGQLRSVHFQNALKTHGQVLIMRRSPGEEARLHVGDTRGKRSQLCPPSGDAQQLQVERRESLSS